MFFSLSKKTKKNIYIYDEIKKTQLVTKLNKSNCDKTQKFELGQNSKTQIGTKIKKMWRRKKSKCDNIQIVTKLKDSIYYNSKLKLWQNSNTQIVTKLEIWQVKIMKK